MINVERGIINMIGELRELIRERDEELEQWKNSYANIQNTVQMLQLDIEKLKEKLKENLQNG